MLYALEFPYILKRTFTEDLLLRQSEYIWLKSMLLLLAKSLQLCLTLCDPIDSSPPGSYVPGKNTGVGCHFLLQCMKVKSESEVAQSCLTPSDPMDCSLPGSSVRDLPGKSTGVGCHCLPR